MEKIAHEMDARKPFDIIEMVRDILSIRSYPRITQDEETIRNDQAYQMELERRAECCDTDELEDGE